MHPTLDTWQRQHPGRRYWLTRRPDGLAVCQLRRDATQDSPGLTVTTEGQDEADTVARALAQWGSR